MAKAEGHRTLHFGQHGASDCTLHHDEARRQAYIARHGRRQDLGKTGVMTPGWLSRQLLWEKRSLPAAIAAASHMHEGVRFRLA